MMKKRTTILLALAVLGAALAVPAQASNPLRFDHMKCYKAKDPAPKASYTVNLPAAGFDLPSATGCVVKVPAKMVCNFVHKANVVPLPPLFTIGQEFFGQLFVCYKAKCPKDTFVRSVLDQFGSRELTASTTKLLCAPSPQPN
jgi:hypothetical protein